MKNLAFRTLLTVLGTAAVLGAAAYAQEPNSGKLIINVSPREAYVFVDGREKLGKIGDRRDVSCVVLLKKTNSRRRW